MIRHKSSLQLANKEELIGILNQQLADSFDLYSQLKQAHWNNRGMHFYALHLLFDELATNILAHMDLLAERATAMGGVVRGTVRMAAKASKLEQSPDTFENSEFTVMQLVARYAQLCSSTRDCIDVSETYGDKVTADLFTEVVRDLDKSLWMLEAHLL